MQTKRDKKEVRVSVFVDGSNLYFKLKAYKFTKDYSGIKFDYKTLCESASDGVVVSKNFYIGVIREKTGDKKSSKMRRDQQRLFAHLKSKNQNFTVKRGYLMQTNNKYHEKGVDVQIAIDLVAGAFRKEYDTAILVSSDTDLIPAIELVQELGRKVIYLGFSESPSFALIAKSNKSKIITKDVLKKYISFKE